jgi:hypothetical protein
MPEKSPIEKIQDAVADVLRGAVADPEGTARKAVDQARGVLSLGFMVVGQVAQTISERLMQSPSQPTPPPSAPKAPIVDRDQPTPADVARVVELKPAAKKAPAKKAPAKKSPSGKLPVKKAPAKKPPTKQAPAAGVED